MTQSLSRTGRLSVLILALAYTGITFGIAALPAPASATGAAYYTATLVAPAGESRAVAGGVAWACAGTTCVAGKGDSRPLRICRGLSRKFGEVASFTANGEELAADELAKCNG